VNKKIFLSIDLDYWAECRSDEQSYRFFKRLAKLGKPVLLVKSHEQMLRAVNRSKCECLINVDAHSDIADDDPRHKPLELSDGTWVNFVSWKKTGEFRWISKDWIKCHCSRDVFDGPAYYPGWRTLTAQDNLVIPWKLVTDIGVAISPGYTNGARVERALTMLGADDLICCGENMNLLHREAKEWKRYVKPRRVRLKDITVLEPALELQEA
jgi:hypothetical protein